MKTKLFFSALILIGFTFYSCDPNGVNSNTGNYWERSALARMNIKGKVKMITLTGNNNSVTTFNESGFVSSIVNTSTDFNSTATYNYNANGQLTSVVTVSTSTSSGSSTSTTNYEYKNTGKYIVMMPMHVYMTGLMPNISSMSTVSTTMSVRTDYVFKNNTTMLIISSNTINSTTSKDTTTIQYSGNYPTGWTKYNMFAKDITYASNGMFKTYTEGFSGPTYNDPRVYTFKTSDDFLMIDNVVENYVDTATPANNRNSTETFSYNSNNDITSDNRDGYITEYFDYVYDSHKNWTSRTSRYKDSSASAWTVGSTETRTITYW